MSDEAQRVTTTEDNEDQGAGYVIALAVHEGRFSTYGHDGKVVVQPAIIAQRILLALSEAGYTVVKTDRFAENVEWIDAHLDRDVAAKYRDQPLAQDWARCAKVVEEAGEAIAELIAITGQNPRKGVHSTEEKLLGELADTALSGVYAIQHFTKDVGRTLSILTAKAAYHRQRIERLPESDTLGGGANG